MVSRNQFVIGIALIQRPVTRSKSPLGSGSLELEAYLRDTGPIIHVKGGCMVAREPQERPDDGGVSCLALPALQRAVSENLITAVDDLSGRAFAPSAGDFRSSVPSPSRLSLHGTTILESPLGASESSLGRQCLAGGLAGCVETAGLTATVTGG